MRYSPPANGRDLRLDFLRGLCLLKMVFNHLVHTPVHGVQRWLGFVTAAEAFFFISGVVVGIVHVRRARENGLGKTSLLVLSRAGQLYLANFALVLLFASLEARGILDNGWFRPLWDGGFEWTRLLVFDQPYYLNILPRYVVFLALTPIALWLLLRGRALLLAAVSFGVWGLHLTLDGGLLLPGVETSTEFPVAAWQLLFFVGMALGDRREQLGAAWRRLTRGKALVPLGLAALFFVVLRRSDVFGLPGLSAELVHPAFGREHLGPLRLINLAVAFAFLFELTHRFWRPLDQRIGGLLRPLGESSLYVFLLHIPLVWWFKGAMARLPVPALGGALWFVLADALLIALLWWAARSRALFGWVPR